jgi:DNA repair exonuclease SbcCD nuclease subunit
MITTLLIADLHLTDLSKDEYRWGIFSWLKDQIEEYEIQRLIILGDLTDKKDKHSSKLVNRLVKNFQSLSTYVKEIIVLKGNHDYVDEDCPFFEFLDASVNIRFVTKPVRIWDSLYLPHTRNPKEDWTEFLKKEGPGTNYIFMHQTVSGSIFANGYKFETDKAEEYNKMLGTQKALVYSGDVHVPQEIGDITYVGSPYSINYGDHWAGRGILLDDIGREITLETDPFCDTFPVKLSIDIKTIDDLNKFIKDGLPQKGDKAKVRIHLSREDFHTYNDLKIQVKKILDKLGKLGIESTIEMKSIKERVNKKVKISNEDLKLQPKEIVEQFSKREQLSKDRINRGLELI